MQQQPCTTNVAAVKSTMTARWRMSKKVSGFACGKPLPKGFFAFGEVGLAGEVRPAPRGQERLKEAAKLGFGVAVVPRRTRPKAIEGLTIHAVDRVEQAMDVVRGLL